MRRTWRFSIAAGLGLCLVGLVARDAVAATGGVATLTGRVVSYDGLPHVGAVIVVRGNGVRSTRLLTGPDGGYRLPALRPFTEYSIAASHKGYRSVEYQGIALEPGRDRTVNFRLKTPEVREVVALVSRDPFPHQELLRGFASRIGVPLRVIDLDEDPDPAETVRRVRAERPNLILGAGLRAARLIRREVGDVPSILTMLPDPRRFDLQAPNLCFLTNDVPAGDLVARVREMLPRAARLGVVYDAETSPLVARDLRLAAGRLGLTLELRPCYGAAGLRGALEGLPGRIDALVVLHDRLTATRESLDLIVGWSLRHRVPLAAPDPEWVRRGALFSYGPALEGIGEEASAMAAQILFQARQPSDFRTRSAAPGVARVNRATAEEIGVVLPAGAGVEIDL